MFSTTKPDGVQIIQIASDATGTMYGLGDDNNIYIWHHSLEYRGKWRLHVITPHEKEL